VTTFKQSAPEGYFVSEGNVSEILVRPSDAARYLEVSETRFYYFLSKGILKPDGRGKKNQPMFFQSTLDKFKVDYNIKPSPSQYMERHNPRSRKNAQQLDIPRVGRPTEDEVHHTGAIIHWTERYRLGGGTFVPVTCAECKDKFNKRDMHLTKGIEDGSFTGCCPSCYQHMKRRSKMRKTGYYKDQDGYILRHRLTLAPEEWEIVGPMCTKNRDYIMEHRIVVSLALGRPLKSHEVVHHKNGTKDDNRIENLVLVEKDDHNRFHGQILTHLNGASELAEKKIATLEDRVAILEDLVKSLIT
jgi:hypothetical protein